LTRSTFLEAALALACVAGAYARRRRPGANPCCAIPTAASIRRCAPWLALVDPARDDREVEVQAARIDARLRVLAGLWSDGRIAEGLASDSWIAPELTVPALFAARDSSANPESTGEWSVQRQAKWPRTRPSARASEGTRGLARRVPARIAPRSRGLRDRGRAERARSEATSHGQRPGAGDTREQHNATWSSTWALDDSGQRWSASSRSRSKP
jgi:hypothetical protein